MARIDIIAAVRNEAENLPILVRRIERLAIPPEVDLHILFVEDSSTDDTRPTLAALSAEKPYVSYYCLERGFGQGPAIVFGISRSEGDAMILMDADGSHPVEAIEAMVEAYLGGAEVVQCVRRILTDRRTHRRLGTTIFQRTARLLIGADMSEQNIFYRLVSRRYAQQLLANPRYWRWLRFPLPQELDGSLVKLLVDAKEREHGESKYTFLRLVNLAIDGTLSIVSPLRLYAWVSVVIMLAALLAILVHPLLGLFALFPGAWVMQRSHRLNDPSILQSMVIVQSGNTRESSSPAKRAGTAA